VGKRMKNIKTKMRTIKDEFLYYEEFINRVYKDLIVCALLELYSDNDYKNFKLPLNYTQEEKEGFLKSIDFCMEDSDDLIGKIWTRKGWIDIGYEFDGAWEYFCRPDIPEELIK
jgi:hypothetical protein